MTPVAFAAGVLLYQSNARNTKNVYESIWGLHYLHRKYILTMSKISYHERRKNNENENGRKKCRGNEQD